jgi:diaminopimelate epimerase
VSGLIDERLLRAERLLGAGRRPFWKTYAEGNSYIVMEECEEAVAAAGWIADRIRGLGGDGLITIDSGAGTGVHRMRVFNADGSEAAWCGNGARSAAAFVCERDGFARGDVVTIASAGGTVEHVLLDRESWTFRAEMPLDHDPVLDVGERRRLVQLEIGVPHLIVFGPRPGDDEVAAAGAALCDARDGGTNVMFASHDDDGGLTVTPWERGVGPVLGCATGAAAAAIASERVLGRRLYGGRVRQPGGAVEVEWDGIAGVLTMTGTVRVVATGTVALGSGMAASPPPVAASMTG